MAIRQVITFRVKPGQAPAFAAGFAPVAFFQDMVGSPVRERYEV